MRACVFVCVGAGVSKSTLGGMRTAACDWAHAWGQRPSSLHALLPRGAPPTRAPITHLLVYMAVAQ